MDTRLLRKLTCKWKRIKNFAFGMSYAVFKNPAYEAAGGATLAVKTFESYIHTLEKAQKETGRGTFTKLLRHV